MVIWHPHLCLDLRRARPSAFVSFAYALEHQHSNQSPAPEQTPLEVVGVTCRDLAKRHTIVAALDRLSRNGRSCMLQPVSARPTKCNCRGRNTFSHTRVGLTINYIDLIQAMLILAGKTLSLVRKSDSRKKPYEQVVGGSRSKGAPGRRRVHPSFLVAPREARFDGSQGIYPLELWPHGVASRSNT